MVAAGAAAILALVIGAAVGRSIIPSGTERKAATTVPPPSRFSEPQIGISLSYPATWTRLRSRDAQVLLVAALSPATSLSLRVSKSQITDVTERKLPVVRGFTDELVAADRRATQLSSPEEVSVSGLPGLRYRYTYETANGTRGAHVHYFLFKRDVMLQLVFQAVPADTLSSVEQTFNGIAASVVSTQPR